MLAACIAAGLFLPLAATYAADPIEIEVRGALARPGPVSLNPAAAGVAEAFAQLGGPLPDAYVFATLLLRLDAATSTRSPCLSPQALQAAWLMRDEPALSNEQAVIAALLAGRMQRLVTIGRSFGRLGSDRGAAAALQSGDVLAVPRRAERVYVVLGDGKVESLEHRVEWLAGDYLDALAGDGLAPRRDYGLYYPDGQVAPLALMAWNAEPTVVPPGSMLAPTNICLQVTD